MKTANKFTTAIATGAIVFNVLAPAVFATNGEIIGNGVNSTSKVNVNKSASTTVNQTNNANITNTISSRSSTGGNEANYNTGGKVWVVTGNITANVTVANAVNLNSAVVKDCSGCADSTYDNRIKDNDVSSENEVELDKSNHVSVVQDNKSDVSNNIGVKARTGDNDVSYNTNGEVLVVTGNTEANISINNAANANTAFVEDEHGIQESSSAKLLENDMYSDNDIELHDASVVVLNQDNRTDIHNSIDTDVDTGYNDMDLNTGSKVTVLTGDVTTAVSVNNLVNFNHASGDCGCVVVGLDATVADNGEGSENEIEVETENERSNVQDNNADLINDVEDHANTGNNETEFSAGSSEDDPLVITGDINSSTEVSNASNINIFGNGASIELPGNWEIGVHFDLSDLLNFFQSSSS